MAIPESQLNTWSHQGAITTSAAAYNSIRTALFAALSPLNGRGVELPELDVWGYQSTHPERFDSRVTKVGK